MFKTQWTHEPVELREDQQLIIDRELKWLFGELETITDLVFHTIFLTGDMHGAIVIVDSRDDVDDTAFLTYYEVPKWVTLDEMEDT